MKKLLTWVLGALLVAGTVYAVTEHRTTIREVFLNGIETATISNPDGSTGNTALTVPNYAISKTELTGAQLTIAYCGELAENGTTYLGPYVWGSGATGVLPTIGSATCDALDNTTESSADNPPIASMANRPMFMACYTDGTLGASESIVFTLRRGEEDSTDVNGDAITCTIGTAATSCVSRQHYIGAIGASITQAVKAVESSNNADDNALCLVTYLTD